MSSEDLQKVLLGWSGGFSAIGGVGGNISFGEHGGIASIETGITARVAVDFTWTVLKGKI